MTWQPTWRRLIATTAVGFALVLALLAWRMQTGHDPALGAAKAKAITTSADDPAASTGDDGAVAGDDDGFSPGDGSSAGLPSTHAS